MKVFDHNLGNTCKIVFFFKLFNENVFWIFYFNFTVVRQFVHSFTILQCSFSTGGHFTFEKKWMEQQQITGDAIDAYVDEH